MWKHWTDHTTNLLRFSVFYFYFAEFVQMMTAKWKLFSILSLFYIACPTKITLSLENNWSEVYFSENTEFQILQTPT